MQNWMEASGYADEEPFVMIDWVSGRLRPLYIINISYDAGSGEVEEDENKVFSPSMLHLVLSPQQKQACEHAMSATNEVRETHCNMSPPLLRINAPFDCHLPTFAFFTAIA
jgi:hypothetical protein